MPCGLLIIVLCLSPYQPTTDLDIHFFQAIGTGVRISAREWQISYSFGDVFKRVDTTGLPEICRDGECVSYTRRCNDADRKRVCELTVYPNRIAVHISFTADGEAQLQDALKHFDYVLRQSKSEVLIPLTQFAETPP